MIDEQFAKTRSSLVMPKAPETKRKRGAVSLVDVTNKASNRLTKKGENQVVSAALASVY